MLKIPEECANEEDLPHLLTKRVIMPYVLSVEVLTLDYKLLERLAKL